MTMSAFSNLAFRSLSRRCSNIRFLYELGQVGDLPHVEKAFSSMWRRRRRRMIRSSELPSTSIEEWFRERKTPKPANSKNAAGDCIVGSPSEELVSSLIERHRARYSELFLQTSTGSVGMPTTFKDVTESGSDHLTRRAERVSVGLLKPQTKPDEQSPLLPPSLPPQEPPMPSVHDPDSIWDLWRATMRANKKTTGLALDESPELFEMETTFRVVSEDFASEKRRMNQLYALWLDDRTSEKHVQNSFEKCEYLSSRLFTMFCYALGAINKPNRKNVRRVAFNKNLCDTAMEQCFGSCNTNPTYLFMYPGLKTLSAFTSKNAARIFSIYLSRKVFVVNNPLTIEKKNQEFLSRVSRPLNIRPEDIAESTTYVNTTRNLKSCILGLAGYSWDRLARLERARRIMHVITDTLFTQKNARRYPRHLYIPNSGKACVEVPQSKGGKRAAIYLSDQNYVDAVRFHTILSGGKFRTITTDSAKNAVDFEFLNDYMFQIIRRLPSMISGRDVEDWAQNVDFSKKWSLSGDLESATDNFDSGLAEIVMQRLTDLFFEGREDVFLRMCSFTTRAHLWDKYQQTNGQLMGSILSFPILCIINLVTNIIADDLDQALFDNPKEFLESYDQCGINGDDVVRFGDDRDELYKRWAFGVSCVGGKPSPGKSLLSDRYFTVNSEIFTNSGEPLHAIRPSLLVALNDGAHKAPDKSWLTYFYSSLWTPALDALFKPDDVLFPDFPVQWGGTRIKKIASFEDFRKHYYRLCLLRSTRPKHYSTFTDEVCLRPGVISNGHTTTVYLGGEKIEYRGKFSSGFVKRSDLKEVAQVLYGVRKLARWTSMISKTRPRAEVLLEARHRYRCSTVYSVELDWRRYNEAWAMEEDGYIYARNVPLDVIPTRFPERDTIIRRVQQTELEQYSSEFAFGGEDKFKESNEERFLDVMMAGSINSFPDLSARPDESIPEYEDLLWDLKEFPPC